MTRSSLAVAAVACLLGAAPEPLSAQAVYGRVTASEREQPLPGASVALLDARGASVVASTTTDSTGVYTFEGSDPGTYLLVASHTGFVSTAPREIELGPVERERVDLALVPLEVATERTRSAQRLSEAAERACSDKISARTSAVMGVVRDSLARVGLGGVPVVLEQVTDDGRLRAVREVTTDAEGFFAFCPLPAPREVAVRAEIGDRRSIVGVKTEAGTGTFLNMALGLATAAEPSDVFGVVRDWETGEPIAGARVLLEGAGRAVTTDAAGRFAFREVPYGVYVVQVENLGYSTAREAFYLNGAATANVEVGLTVSAIDVDPIVVSVEARRRVPGDLARFQERMNRGMGIFLTEEDLERRALGGGVALSEALMGLPAVRIERTGPHGSAVYLRSAFSLAGGRCQPTLYVDGIRYALDPDLGWDEPIGGIEAIEVYRGAAEVPAEFSGTDASCGVVVVWTKRGR